MSWPLPWPGSRGAEDENQGDFFGARLFPSASSAHHERVMVRVYDLGRTFLTRWHNQVTKSYGAFHTGVEVYGREWCFGMTLDEWSTGITWNVPGMNADHTFRETLSMGFTTCGPQDIMKIIDEMKVEWRGCTYSVLSRNCHNFSDEFCQRLGVARLPAWVNQLAGTGQQSAEFLESADSGYDGGEAISHFLHGVKTTLFGTPAFEAQDPFMPDRVHPLQGISSRMRRSKELQASPEI